jgi:hypothetical protein
LIRGPSLSELAQVLAALMTGGTHSTSDESSLLSFVSSRAGQRLAEDAGRGAVAG